jgi:molybdopterin-synthase adenylyltransferase
MDRYSRHTILDQIGLAGQKKIAKAHVVLVGCGALGTVAAELLARAGIGTITLIDRDIVELSNLHRQSLFREGDVGKPKSAIAQNILQQINSQISIRPCIKNLTTQNISTIISTPTLILDCTDNIKTRLVINDYARENKLTWIYAAAVKTKGSLSFISPDGPCLRCFFPENSQGETCTQSGVLSTLTHTIAAMQVTLALKFLLGKDVPNNELLYYNAWDNSIQKLKTITKKDCTHSGIIQENLREQFCGGKYQIHGTKINLDELKKKLEKTQSVEYDSYTLKCGPLLIFNDGRAIIKAKSHFQAEKIYSQLVGN